MSRYLINQPAGLGDIIYCQKIARYYIDNGNDVIWPVTSQYSWISDYIKYPGLTFVEKGGKYKYDKYLDLENGAHRYPGYHMDAKYKCAGLDGSDWVDYFEFIHNVEREDALFKRIGPADGSKYSLVNNTYATPPHTITRDFSKYIARDVPVIHIEFIEGYTPFDWCKVIENASNLYLIDTCFIWIIEKLKPKACNMCLFSRNHGSGENVPSSYESIHLFKTHWTIMDWRK